VYAHILGFTGLKGFVPFEDFLGQDPSMTFRSTST
jgi:hypothetical protein